ncbi:MAG TPA: hypothetical protein VMM56_17120, partial [Planctomycetaceae bacterium]|nr:hypothetical protein [Planctomycetaceae bacterium]
MVRWTLEPGEVAELHALTAGIGLIGTPGKYTLRYGINFRGVVKNNGEGESGSPKPTDHHHLYTGETPIAIRSRPLSLESISPNGEIIGRLIDPETSEPIGGATVSCAAMISDSGNKARVHAVTDGEGRYRLRVPSPGVYSVWLRNKPSNTDDGILVEAGKIAASSLRLISNRNVFGKVVDSAGNPIPNRVVSCYSPDRPYAGNVQSIRTKEDGSFLLKAPPGRAYVHVDPKSGPPDQNLFGTNRSARVHINIPESGKMEPITLQVLDSEPGIGDSDWVKQSTAGTQIVRREGDEGVSGTVVDKHGNPIEGAQVFRLDDAVSRTDKRGQFRIDTDKNTQFVMYAFAPGYHVWIGSPTSGDALKIVMEPKQIPVPATPGTKDENQPDKKQSSVPDKNGIYWSKTVTDGFRTGARLVAKEGRITGGEPLEIQYLLKNETDIAQTLDFVRSKPAFPSLEEENRIDLSLFPAHDKPQTRTLQAREVWEDSQNRVSIDTTGFPAGEYVVWIQNFFLRPDPDDSNRKTGIPIRRSISVVIDPSKASVAESEATNSPTEKSNDPDNIAWGKSVAGIQVGSRFVGESREFPIPSEPQLQLFVRNLTRTPIEIDVLLPHPNDGWLLNVENDRGEHAMLQRTPISSFWPEQSYRLTLAPGETIPITGAERTVNFGPTNVKHATFGIAKEKPSEGFWNGGILITNGGRYQAKLTMSFKRVDMPGLRLRVDAVAAPFRVNGPLLEQETPRPISLHGFNLGPYRAAKNREELQKTEPILDRNRSHAEGGSWCCWLDSAEHYNQWLVCYDPGQQIFYVVDEKSEDKIVYGPIPGDAIEKFRLREGSSDLVAAKADEQNIARAANLHVRRIQSLLESNDSSLQTHGLKAFVELGDLPIYELRNWSERIEKVADSEAGRDQLKPLVEAAQKYLQDQRDRIESLKVQLDDSEYKPGREPTRAELDAEWGPVNAGLSLAIADWPREVRTFEVNDQPQITLLVRNNGDTATRISTLNVLDGV